MKMRLFTLAATVTLSVSTLVAYADGTVSYTDINGHWAQSDITTLSQMDVIGGSHQGEFHPDAWVSRAEFTEMGAKTIGLAPNKADQVPSFKKVSKNDWGFAKVDNADWISAYPTGVFRPANPVRRVEALASVAGAINKPTVTEEEATTILSKYSDADQIPASARREVATAIQYNLYAIDPKSGGTLIEPLRPITKAESAALFNDLYQNRDIAIVQNGQVIASSANMQGGASMPATSSSTMTTSSTTTSTSGTATMSSASSGNMSSGNGETSTGTSMVSGADSTTGENTTSPSANNAAGTQAAAEPGPLSGYGPMAASKSWLSGTVPYRNSADTIPEFRSVNTTTTPSNLEAAQPINLPANTTFTGTVAKALYSEFNQPGDPVMLILDHPLMDVNGRIVAPAGSKVLGVVNSVVSHNASNDSAQLGISFNGVITPTGQRIPLNAIIANADGILKADDLQGVVFHPNHSTAALQREISTAEGGLYGTKVGKAYVLEEPLVSQKSDRPMDALDKTKNDIVIGVGDRLQLKVESTTTPTTTQ